MHELKLKIISLAKSKNLGRMTLKQIADAVGLNGPSGAIYHLSSLYKDGYLKKQADGTVIVSGDHGSALTLNSIPIRGEANCGPATLYADDVISGYLQVSNTLRDIGENMFALRARGSSMSDAKFGERKQSICDGDYVIIDATRRQPVSGDYIVAILDGLANIKRFHLDINTGEVVLISESTEDFPPIYLHKDDLDKFFVAGTVKHVLKKPAVTWN